MDTLKWFKIECIYPIDLDFNGNGNELSEIDQLRLKNEGLLEDYETGVAVLNLLEDVIVHLLPKVFIPKGKVYKKYYTEVVMKSGDILYAVGRPDQVYDKVNDYLESLPEKPILEEEM
jgi:hypothetical protein